ncbi:MAG: hypothetical protein DSY43_01110, partial [Gammaproteobacteria bacterium]
SCIHSNSVHSSEEHAADDSGNDATGLWHFLNWNCEGFLTKLSDPDIIGYLTRFSFICLTESFLEYFDNENCLVDYECFTAPALRFSQHGRRSGGVVCFIQKSIVSHFTRLNVTFRNIVVFNVDKTVFGTANDVLLLCAYIPPAGSVFYESAAMSDGIHILEQCMLELLDVYGECHFIMFGDFNSRTGAQNVAVNSSLQDVSMDLYEARCSRDDVINPFGRSLLSLCLSFELTILNGCVAGDALGKYTYISNTGDSVIDYLIISAELRDLCESLVVQENVLSSHMYVEFNLYSNMSAIVDSRRNDMIQTVYRRWNDVTIPVFVDYLKNEIEVSRVTEYLSAETTDVDLAVDCLTRGLINAAEFMSIRRLRKVNSTRNYVWFDNDCHAARRELHRLLHKYTRTQRAEDKSRYIAKRQQYKRMIRDKKSCHRETTVNAIENSMRDSKEFWGRIRNITYKSRIRNDIRAADWVQHFSRIHDQGIDNNRSIEHVYQNLALTQSVPEVTGEIDADISAEEIRSAIKNLKVGKAAGPDELVAEMFKHSASFLVPYLTQLFNAMFHKGHYPKTWTKSILVPIYKKGSINNPDNYRGISLTSTFSKIFTHVLNKRLQVWAEENEVIWEGQAGFRRGYSTIDNIFVLHSVIQKYLARHKKVYIAFVDYKKAFDMIDRTILWDVLKRNGISGRMYYILKAMYCSVQSCVRCDSGCSEYFACTKGLKQGCVLSSFLFTLMVQEILSSVCKYGRHGIQLHPDVTQIFILMFADDVALVSDTVLGLQNQLDVLQKHSDKCGLSINLDKSKVVVFRNGGHIARHEKWNVGNRQINIVNEYRYLGVILSTRLCTNTVLADLSIRGKAGAIRVLKALRQLGHISPDVFFRIFDAQIQPMLLYGSEVWGMDDSSQTETVHMFALKKFLNVHMSTPNVIAYGETGRYPLSVCSAIRSVKYWLRLLKMENSRYPKKVYRMMLADENNQSNWTSKIRNLLSQHGFEDIWRQQETQNDIHFIKDLRERLIQKYDNHWRLKLVESARYAIYKQIKPGRYKERYLYALDQKIFRTVFARFRAGVCDIFSHRFRYCDPNIAMCPCCMEEEEDDIHFLLQCPVYADLREKYMSSFECPPNFETFVNVLSSPNDKTIRGTSRYIFYALKRREEALSNPM